MGTPTLGDAAVRAGSRPLPPVPFYPQAVRMVHYSLLKANYAASAHQDGVCVFVRE